MYYSAIGILATMVLVIENLDIILNRNRSFSLPAWNAYRRLPKYKNDPSVAQVFRRADKNMYDDKASLKLYLKNNQSNS